MYIDLKRKLKEIPIEQLNEEYDLALRWGNYGSVSWQDIINEYRTVILSEAGTGKTEELKHLTKELRSKRLPAFFIRLEDLTGDFEDAFELGSYKEFTSWMESENEGWLLLDSIDEARLSDPKDFERAIKKISRRLTTALDRVHIVLTGRTSAWRPKSDLALCDDMLPLNQNRTANSKEAESPSDSISTSDSAISTAFKFYQLVELSRDQIKMFAEAKGIPESIKLLDDIERVDAWGFTTRPQDLIDIIEYWSVHNKLGTRMELMESNIQRKLAERSLDRVVPNELPIAELYSKAQTLAAVSTLTQVPHIELPEGSTHFPGISSTSMLRDWNGNQILNLLKRPIFDEAIYGAVRFHHRSVREFLTARWFNTLLSKQSSHAQIESLFFRTQYDIEVLTPTLRPILPWLVIWNENFRERISQIDPKVFFEGGDPSQLNLGVRKDILRDVCEALAKKESGQLQYDTGAIQRFASQDLAEHIRVLFEVHSGDEDVLGLLLKMIWTGRIKGLEKEVIEAIKNPSIDKYTHISAIRAAKAICSTVVMDTIRDYYLENKAELNREILSELIEDLKINKDKLNWLIACIKKLSPPNEYSYDRLGESLKHNLKDAQVDESWFFISQIEKLMKIEPYHQTWRYRISQRYGWLLPIAADLIDKLISKQASLALKPEVLELLQMISVAREYNIRGINELKEDFSKKIPEWSELNWALFWSSLEQTRENVKWKVQNYRQAYLYGKYWSFGPKDFEQAIWELSHRQKFDDRKIVLSLAFDLYKSSGEKPSWLNRIRDGLSEAPDLLDYLSLLLDPPPPTQEELELKEQEKKWEIERKEREDKDTKYHDEWKSWLKTNLKRITAEQLKNPGVLTDSLWYLHRRTERADDSSSRWTSYNWSSLKREYGKQIAKYYRDGAVNFWRNYKPQIRSEGADFNSTKGTVIFGLTGLEIEAHENTGWIDSLTPEEVKLACRYASFELNGFPTWLPKVFKSHPQEVSGFLWKEIEYQLEMETECSQIHYILDKVNWTGDWCWDSISPQVLCCIQREPKNLRSLDTLLKIVMCSSCESDVLKRLSSKKCKQLKSHTHLARWYAVWVAVEPSIAIDSLESKLKGIDDEMQEQFAMLFLTSLLGDRRTRVAHERNGFKRPVYLRRLYLLMHKYIRLEDDINRSGGGVYSPTLRDDAQDARELLFRELDALKGRDAFYEMKQLAFSHPDPHSRKWMLEKVKIHAETDCEIGPWKSQQVLDFQNTLERTPKNHIELAELAVFRLKDLKRELEEGDDSIAETLQKVDEETEMRNFIAYLLRSKSNGRYSVPQEEEMADAKRPDIRFHGNGFDAPVPVELKLAENWTGPKLAERLENQLCGDYLRDSRSDRGIFLLVLRKSKSVWMLPNGKAKSFPELIVKLEQHWKTISARYTNVSDIQIIGIDLMRRNT
ncbi:ATP-binding protein [Vibrio coralliilyticus]|uniref:ATP-binding protein n=1 Tax=Vibrio coralliilyticus TaxID=190893 RepID=UPI00117C94DE|nr:ATP-binding protein [Vibrio coralliilyticus]NOI58887.1 ATP-binding protein [Vibrio coralliilyticus]